MAHFRFIFAITFAALFASALPSRAQVTCTSAPACTSSSSCYQRLSIGSGTVQVYRSHDLTKKSCDIRHAIVMVHGRDLNPADYFGYATNAAKAKSRTKDTLVVSPSFRESSNGTDLYWDRDLGSEALYDWAMGGRSANGAKISAYAVMDDLVKRITTSGNYPNLKSVVIAGHSGGAQLTQRYAVGGNPASSTLKFFYVSANPSSYAYLDKRRPLNGSTTAFAQPTSSSCRYFDEWGYGLDDLNPYMQQFSYSTLVGRYSGRKVTYLLGDKDTSTSGIDTSCFANLQGKNRFIRGMAYANYIAAYYPSAQHTRVVVPGVGHSASSMFGSTQGRTALFPLP